MKRSLLILNILIAGFSTAMAQEAAAKEVTKTSAALDWSFYNVGLILAAMITALAILFLIKVLNTLMEVQRINFIKEHGMEVAKEANLLQPQSFWTGIYKRLTKAIPIAQEQNIDLGHDYDGIRELDNSLPPWWVYMFYITIVFAGIYLYWYHFSDKGQDQLQEYEYAMEEGEKVKAAYMSKMADAINEANVTALTDATALNEGKTIFKTYCAACHLETGGGSVGPNLTDDYWIHGGGIKNLFKTVKFGVPEKGMISWKEQLRPSEMQKVTSYILTLHGTNPPVAKAPQGEIYKEGSETTTVVDTTSAIK